MDAESPVKDPQSKGEKWGKLQNQEVIIDIHVKKLRMKVEEQMSIRIVWKRGKKTAMTQPKSLSPETDTAVFDEKF
jgi:hypothetical protein